MIGADCVKFLLIFLSSAGRHAQSGVNNDLNVCSCAGSIYSQHSLGSVCRKDLNTTGNNGAIALTGSHTSRVIEIVVWFGVLFSFFLFFLVQCF